MNMPDSLKELLAIITLAITLPSLCASAWHGWKYEKRREQLKEEDTSHAVD